MPQGGCLSRRRHAEHHQPLQAVVAVLLQDHERPVRARGHFHPRLTVADAGGVGGQQEGCDDLQPDLEAGPEGALVVLVGAHHLRQHRQRLPVEHPHQHRPLLLLRAHDAQDVQQPGHRQPRRTSQVYLCVDQQELQQLRKSIHLQIVVGKQSLKQLLQLLSVLLVLQVPALLLLFALLLIILLLLFSLLSFFPLSRFFSLSGGVDDLYEAEDEEEDGFDPVFLRDFLPEVD